LQAYEQQHKLQLQQWQRQQISRSRLYPVSSEFAQQNFGTPGLLNFNQLPTQDQPPMHPIPERKSSGFTGFCAYCTMCFEVVFSTCLSVCFGRRRREKTGQPGRAPIRFGGMAAMFNQKYRIDKQVLQYKQRKMLRQFLDAETYKTLNRAIDQRQELIDHIALLETTLTAVSTKIKKGKGSMDEQEYARLLGQADFLIKRLKELRK
jgi:hypothetical protein